ncbi:MAG TPA: cytochrome c oxidase assembly protein [Pseudomonadales bacterium]|nr:cytochrome c oxidase assembly protein [Pseudomonadales bacterium]
MTPSDVPNKNAKLALKIGLIGAGMFCFALFVLPPFYTAICKWTGLNGKTQNQAAATEKRAVDMNRTIRVSFVTDVGVEMPWEFTPETRTIEVHPGQPVKVNFRVKNESDTYIVAQAIPSVAPGLAAQHFKKTECFCFREQPLEAHAEKEMPVVFFVDPELPPDIQEITLAYRLYNITAKAQTNAVSLN